MSRLSKVSPWQVKILRSLTKAGNRKYQLLSDNEKAILLGWCMQYRPGSDPSAYEFRFDFNVRPFEVHVAPLGCDEEDEWIGPYSPEQMLEFAKRGVEVMAAAKALVG